MASSRTAIEKLEEEIGYIDIMFGFDCIYRKLDAKNRQTTLRTVVSRKKFIGINTYSEPFNAMHINQTFTGIAIGASVITADIRTSRHES